METENDSDFVTILSSELIASIVEQYFNAEMYKVPVRIVDLKPTGEGYAFSLAFVTVEQQLSAQKEKNAASIAMMDDFQENGTETMINAPLSFEEYKRYNRGESYEQIVSDRGEKSDVTEYTEYVKSGDFKRNGGERDSKGRFTAKSKRIDDSYTDALRNSSY